jgi:hypothetical protein
MSSYFLNFLKFYWIAKKWNKPLFLLYKFNMLPIKQNNKQLSKIPIVKYPVNYKLIEILLISTTS